ncbi:DUF4878 domain-containing protein [Lutibacter sp. A64]|uniref:DUF4878 domain-containing protein n=1 Tax=Lutibacter sp. A64 TaxID=2918526 RepID=UPI001F069317|nr:DUF4878 domain-containing protein [Lutibacter sp. A64]UMB54286.1 DUF4878 domain-containing protein [Lutibacter sp. A64]
MKHLKLASALLLTIVLFSVSSCGSGTSPGDTIKKAYDLMKAKDFEKVTTLYVTGEGKKFSEEEAKKMEGLFGMAAKEEFDNKDGLKNIVIDNETIAEDGNSARVDYTVNFKNGDSEKENAKLIKIDGKWFIKV